MIQSASFAVFAIADNSGCRRCANNPYGRQGNARWFASDRCAKAAQAAFPDLTAESYVKRDQLLKQCLAGGNLAPRSSLESPKARTRHPGKANPAGGPFHMSRCTGINRHCRFTVLCRL